MNILFLNPPDINKISESTVDEKACAGGSIPFLAPHLVVVFGIN